MRNVCNRYRIIRPAVIIALLAVVHYGCIQRTVIQDDFQTRKVLGNISEIISENDILSAVAQIDLVTPHGHYPAKAVIILKKPSYLRLEILSPIGPPDFFLASTPDTMRIFIPSKATYYHGAPTAANLTRFLPWPFDIEDTVMILTGAYPVLDGGSVSAQSCQNENYLRVKISSPAGNSQIIQLGDNNRLINFAQNDKYGKEIYHVQYEEYKPENRVPGKITISMADGISSLRVKYSELQIETADDLTIFDLTVPNGIKSIILD